MKSNQSKAASFGASTSFDPSQLFSCNLPTGQGLFNIYSFLSAIITPDMVTRFWTLNRNEIRLFAQIVLEYDQFKNSNLPIDKQESPKPKRIIPLDKSQFTPDDFALIPFLPKDYYERKFAGQDAFMLELIWFLIENLVMQDWLFSSIRKLGWVGRKTVQLLLKGDEILNTLKGKLGKRLRQKLITILGPNYKEKLKGLQAQLELLLAMVSEDELEEILKWMKKWAGEAAKASPQIKEILEKLRKAYKDKYGIVLSEEDVKKLLKLVSEIAEEIAQHGMNEDDPSATATLGFLFLEFECRIHGIGAVIGAYLDRMRSEEDKRKALEKLRILLESIEDDKNYIWCSLTEFAPSGAGHLQGTFDDGHGGRRYLPGVVNGVSESTDEYTTGKGKAPGKGSFIVNAIFKGWNDSGFIQNCAHALAALSAQCPPDYRLISATAEFTIPVTITVTTVFTLKLPNDDGSESGITVVAQPCAYLPNQPMCVRFGCGGDGKWKWEESCFHGGSIEDLPWITNVGADEMRFVFSEVLNVYGFIGGSMSTEEGVCVYDNTGEKHLELNARNQGSLRTRRDP